MLAGKADLRRLKYPLYASPKLDGVRGLIHKGGTLRSRSWKTFPNEFVQTRFSVKSFSGLDGELILGDPTAKDVYRVTNSALQRESGKPDVTFYVFDIFTSILPFSKRLEDMFFGPTSKYLVRVSQVVVSNEKDLLTYEEQQLDLGYEGVMLRSPDGLYKNGRATANGGELLKLKRFEDSEAEIVSAHEEMHNGNEAKKDAYGRTERSSHKANLVGKGRLGYLTVRDINTGVVFDVGTGFTAEEREELWKIRDRLPGRIIKYKFFAIGVKDKPRHPVYLGPREAWDLS